MPEIRTRPRVVSLVPSHSETLHALGADLVGVTRFCVVPPELAGSVPAVGGTKNPDVDAIVALAPDLVVMNQEENRVQDHEALVAAGLEVLATFTRTVEDAVADTRILGEAAGVGAAARRLAGRFEDELAALVAEKPPWAPDVLAVFCPVWRRPWISFSADTYAADVLTRAGAETIYADADERYPEVTLSDAAARRPDIALLPDEPYAFDDTQAGEVEAALGVAAVLCDGQALHWYGPRLVEGIRTVKQTLAEAVGKA